MISINQQIEEVQRELGQRERVYPRLVASGKLKASHADYQVQRMQAVLKTLQWVQANRDKLHAIKQEAAE
jgi:hypothetical protein